MKLRRRENATRLAVCGQEPVSRIQVGSQSPGLRVDRPEAMVRRAGERAVANGRRAYAALRHTVDALEETSWSKSIIEREIRLSVSLEGKVLSVSPISTVPGPSAPQVRYRHSEDRRRQNVRTHIACLRGDLLSIGSIDPCSRRPGRAGRHRSGSEGRRARTGVWARPGVTAQCSGAPWWALWTWHPRKMAVYAISCSVVVE
ncbi:hypothetical protein ACIP6I_22750 [Streptomyces anulatus]